MDVVDLLIVGAGLAGTTLAWQAHMSGISFALFDRADRDASSRVAAGLVTPITGSRFATSWRWNEAFRTADPFYREAEARTASQFWEVREALRLFVSDAERAQFQSRWLNQTLHEPPHLEDSVSPFASLLEFNPTGFRAEFGGMRMTPAARLDTNLFLENSWSYFQSRYPTFQIDLNIDEELHCSPEGVSLHSSPIRARYAVLCQGFAARENRFFRDLPLHPARGDILRIRSRTPFQSQIVHHHAWAVPVADEELLIGATYDRHCLDTATDNEASRLHRLDLQKRWEQMVEGTFDDGSHELLSHRVGVRPASYDRHPLMGQHASYSQLYCLNGLGSKGSLMAPYLAQQLLNHIFQQTPIDKALNHRRRESRNT